jgi:hypothetical protein
MFTIDPSDQQEAELDLYDNLARISKAPPALTESTEFECQELLSSVTAAQATAEVFEMDDDSWQCGHPAQQRARHGRRGAALFPGTKVAFGPATDNGFYYDYDRPNGSFTDDDLRAIEAKMQEIIAADTPFRARGVTKRRGPRHPRGAGRDLQARAPRAPRGADLGLPPRRLGRPLRGAARAVRRASSKAVQLTTVAGAYWRGDERNPMLQRIYGTAFASQKALEAHLKQLEEAKARDHRKLGKELDLFMFHPWAPASPFFLPRGARLQRLVEYVRHLYVGTGYEEVITPQIFDKELFETSGHLPAYSREHVHRGHHREPREGEAARSRRRAPKDATSAATRWARPSASASSP